MLLFLALIPAAFGFSSQELKTGDVLLQSLPCSICRLIEVEEGAPYSHVGVVYVDEQRNASVIESLSEVERIPLPEFIKKRKTNTSTLVLRPVHNGDEVSILSSAFLSVYEHDFAGRHYDPRFLWNNRDAAGELFYCSELVAKLLNRFLPNPIMPKAMHYTHYRSDWIQYFKTTPPDGLPGISPADFSRSPFFKRIGEIKN